MDDRIWRNISIGLGVICALLIGIAGALMIVDNRGQTTAGASPTPTRGAVPTSTVDTTAAAPTNTLTVASAPPGTLSPGASQSALATTVIFSGIALDAEKDEASTIRTFVFESDGVGPVQLAVTRTSAGGTTRMCAKVDTQPFACKVGTLPNFLKAYADTNHSVWTVTLVGYGTSKPTVDLSLTWPANTGKVTINHLRFQGSSSPGISEGLNGFTATFTPRAGGSAKLQASWTQVTVNASVSLVDVTSTPTVKVDQRDYSTVTYLNPDYSYAVDANKTYQLKLRNTSPDSGDRPDLTVQLLFP